MNFDTRISSESEINSQNIEKMISDGVDKGEGLRIINFIEKSVTPLPEKLKIIVESLKGIETEKKILTDSTKKSLIDLIADIETGKLGNSVENNNQINSYESLEKFYENNEAMKSFLELFDSYIDIKLNKSNFSAPEKENIKIVLIGKLTEKLSIVDFVSNNITGMFKDFTKIFKGKTEESMTTKEKYETVSKIFIQAKEALTGLTSIDENIDVPVVEYIDSLIQNNIDVINNKKKENEINKNDINKFDNLVDIENHINKEKITKTSKEIFDGVKNETDKLANSLKNGRETGKGLEKLMNEHLPEEAIDWIKNSLKELGEKHSIIGMILSLIFGKEFLDEKNNKSFKSTKNLAKFSKNDKFPLKDNIKPEELSKLDQKKLEKFYKYMESKNIDYSSETFWQELLTGKSENKKIIETYNLLKNSDGNILTEKQDLSNLVSKLNNLDELDRKKEQENVNKQNSKVDKKITAINTNLNKSEKTKEVLQAVISAKTEVEKNKIISESKKIIEESGLKIKDLKDTKKVKEISVKVEKNIKNTKKDIQNLEHQKVKTFEEYLIEGKIKVGDKLENISIDEKEHILKIGNDNYKVIIDTLIGNLLEKISFKNGIIKLVANGTKKEFGVPELKLLLNELLNKGEIDKKIPGKSANLIIKKV